MGVWAHVVGTEISWLLLSQTCHSKSILEKKNEGKSEVEARTIFIALANSSDCILWHSRGLWPCKYICARKRRPLDDYFYMSLNGRKEISILAEMNTNLSLIQKREIFVCE